jgi:hypothetical protein
MNTAILQHSDASVRAKKHETFAKKLNGKRRFAKFVFTRNNVPSVFQAHTFVHNHKQNGQTYFVDSGVFNDSLQ